MLHSVLTEGLTQNFQQSREKKQPNVAATTTVVGAFVFSGIDGFAVCFVCAIYDYNNSPRAPQIIGKYESMWQSNGKLIAGI